MTDAGAAGVCQYGGVYVEQRTHLPIALDGCAHLLGAGRNHKRRSGGDAARFRLFGDVSGAAHILIRRVCAASDERRRYVVHEAVGGVRHLCRQRRYGAGAVGRVGAYDVRFKRGQVEPHHAVVMRLRVGFNLSVRLKQMPILFGYGDDAGAVGGG